MPFTSFTIFPNHCFSTFNFKLIDTSFNDYSACELTWYHSAVYCTVVRFKQPLQYFRKLQLTNIPLSTLPILPFIGELSSSSQNLVLCERFSYSLHELIPHITSIHLLPFKLLLNFFNYLVAFHSSLLFFSKPFHFGDWVVSNSYHSTSTPLTIKLRNCSCLTFVPVPTSDTIHRSICNLLLSFCHTFIHFQTPWPSVTHIPPVELFSTLNTTLSLFNTRFSSNLFNNLIFDDRTHQTIKFLLPFVKNTVSDCRASIIKSDFPNEPAINTFFNNYSYQQGKLSNLFPTIDSPSLPQDILIFLDASFATATTQTLSVSTTVQQTQTSTEKIVTTKSGNECIILTAFS